jgi:hypothetical protein
MNTQDEHNETNWGARVNASTTYQAKDCPSWATRPQRDKWNDRGLILWDHETQQITRLWASQALELLDYLRANDSWREKGVEVGEPAIALSIDHPDQEPKQVLADKIQLDPDQLCELLKLLETREQTLHQMKDDDEQERSRRLWQVYALLLGLAREKRGEDTNV